MIVSDDGRLLFAVNAGSNSISSFCIRPNGLERESRTASTSPAQVDLSDDGDVLINTLFVSEAGAGGGASSYRIGEDAPSSS